MGVWINNLGKTAPVAWQSCVGCLCMSVSMLDAQWLARLARVGLIGR